MYLFLNVFIFCPPIFLPCPCVDVAKIAEQFCGGSLLEWEGLSILAKRISAQKLGPQQ